MKLATLTLAASLAALSPVAWGQSALVATEMGDPLPTVQANIAPGAWGWHTEATGRNNGAYVGGGSDSDYARQQQELMHMPGYSVGGNG